MYISNELLNLYNSGVPIKIINSKQKRTHKKKRINKKWLKRYGYHHTFPIDDDKVYIINNEMLMSKNAYDKLKKHIPTITRSDLF